ncbi:hypothetical protein NC651_019030 [Populus alba x Populus x berolinensis]|nr:hypothetical protein NC651_019030 [Populus alba x Populus x berolinensis]
MMMMDDSGQCKARYALLLLDGILATFHYTNHQLFLSFNKTRQKKRNLRDIW